MTSPSRRTRLRAGTALTVMALAAAVAVPTTAHGATAHPTPGVAFDSAPEPQPPYVGQVACDPTEKPGVTALRELLLRTYGVANSGGSSRSCAGTSRSEHKEGRAYDWMLDVADPAEKAMADAFLGWLVGPDAAGVEGGNARRLGIMYVIWNKRSWSAWTGEWKAYTGASPHTDHVHISLTWDGAFKRTSWWAGATVPDHDYGPCVVYTGEPAPPYSSRRTTPCPSPVPRQYQLISGDWDGDGDDEAGSYSDGRFALTVSGTKQSFAFGRAGDVAVVGDWDADGRDEVGVFRSGSWYLRNSLSAGPSDRSLAFGRAGDVPVTGVWDRGHQGIGVRRGNQWYLRSGVSNGPHHVAFGFGSASDTALVGDWNRDGVDDPGVRRGNEWYLASSFRSLGAVTRFAFGASTQRPVTGDWDGNGSSTSGSGHLSTVFWRNDHSGGASTASASIPF